MPLKSSEAELKRKREYYKANKEKILEKKHSRSMVSYTVKRMREISSEDEYHKEQMRKLSKLEHLRPDACELCGVKEADLGYNLEADHPDYNSTEVNWLCKPCHAESDSHRRRS